MPPPCSLTPSQLGGRTTCPGFSERQQQAVESPAALTGAQYCDAAAHLSGADVAIAVLVKHLERLAELLLRVRVLRGNGTGSEPS